MFDNLFREGKIKTTIQENSSKIIRGWQYVYYDR